jgi:ABC-2 type transport system permease protein
MQNVLIILQRELASYFNSALVFVIVPIFLLMVGGFSMYFQAFFLSGILDMRSIFFWCAVSFLLLIPAFSMRAFAEEIRTGSIEMLVTLPISEEEMVIGKFLSVFVVVCFSLLLTLSYPMTLSTLGNLDWGPVLGGYIGLALLGAALSAIGIAASATSKNQVVSFLIAFAVSVVPFAMGYVLSSVPVDILPVVQYLSFDYHFSNLAKGVVDSRNIIFYLSVVALFLHLAVFQLEQRRLK